jgi:hypothetical protein
MMVCICEERVGGSSFLLQFRKAAFLVGWMMVCIHCKKELAVFPPPAGMSLIKLFLGGNNLVFSRPERVWSVTSRLGTGKWLPLFYSVGAERVGGSSFLLQFRKAALPVG